MWTKRKKCPQKFGSFKTLPYLCTRFQNLTSKTIMEQKKEGRVIVKYQDKIEYIKNPMMMVERLGSFKLPAQKIMFEIIASIQPNIERYYSLCKKFGKDKIKDIPIDDEIDINGKMTHQIPLKDLCKHTSDYDAIREAAEALSLFIVKVPIEKKDGSISDGFRQFMAVDVPRVTDDGRARGYVDVIIDENVVKHFFSLTSGGYAEHIRGIVNIAKGKYTVAIYTMLSKYFSQSEYDGECQIKYSDLRLNLKVDQYVYEPDKKNPDPGVYVKVKQSKYAQYRDFKKRVLDTAKAELKKLWDENKGVDFWFDYEEIKVEGVRLSTNGPKAIRFIMRNERKVQAVAEKKKDTQEIVTARNKFAKFYNPCLERVGQEVFDMYYKLVKKAECYSNGAVVVYFDDGMSRDAWKENIYVPCKEEWYSIFGNVEPVLKDLAR